jgi:hypothetical protein
VRARGGGHGGGQSPESVPTAQCTRSDGWQPFQVIPEQIEVVLLFLCINTSLVQQRPRRESKKKRQGTAHSCACRASCLVRVLAGAAEGRGCRLVRVARRSVVPKRAERKQPKRGCQLAACRQREARGQRGGWRAEGGRAAARCCPKLTVL